MPTAPVVKAWSEYELTLVSFYDGVVGQAQSAILANAVVERLRAAGYQTYLVGGGVRDRLLGRLPKDYDVATDARPDEVMALYPDALQVGAHFGVVLLARGGDQVEIATFRSDHAYTDGRHPDRVEFETEPRQDALRRDFTINALFLDPLSGEVHDYVGGRADLEAKVIRAIGDPLVRFREDHLRMLRAVRFAARLGFAIEPATMAAVQQLAPAIRQVAAERVRDELERILTEGAARRGFELLQESGLLVQVLPEVAAMQGVEQPPEYHPEGDVWTHTLMAIEQLPAGVTPTLAWGVLLHDVGKPPTQTFEGGRFRFNGHAGVGAEMACEILTRLRASNDEIRQVEALVANHMRFGDIPKMRESTLKRFLRLDRFDEHLELHRIDCASCHRRFGIYDLVQQKRQELSQEQLAPPRLLTGRDLIQAGYRPGPQFSQILEQVEDAQLENRLQTKEEALAFVREQFPPAA